jgi:hypothetical protein
MSRIDHVLVRVRVIVVIWSIGMRPTPGREDEDGWMWVGFPDLGDEVNICLFVIYEPTGI